MKKIIYFLFVLMVVVSQPQLLHAQTLSKATRKLYKNECKHLKKEGWKVFSTHQSVDDAMLPYYRFLDQGGGRFLHFIGSGKSQSVNTARRKAMSNASVQLAAAKGNNVQATMTSRLTNNEDAVEKTTPDFDAVFRSNTEQSIKSFVPLVSLCRDLPDGMVEMRLYYVVEIK